MIQGHDDQMAASHLLSAIANTMHEIQGLYPGHAPLTPEAALLTAGVLLLVRQAGNDRAAQAVHRLAQGIEDGQFDQDPWLRTIRIQ